MEHEDEMKMACGPRAEGGAVGGNVASWWCASGACAPHHQGHARLASGCETLPGRDHICPSIIMPSCIRLSTVTCANDSHQPRRVPPALLPSKLPSSIV